MSENNDNIPLDEMMRNLKKVAHQKQSRKVEGGELVVRADGSEAIKVKSKKRRSVQPKKEIEKKNAKRKVMLIAGVIGLVILSFIAFSVLLGYFNGNRFKSKLSETIANVSGADVELGKVDVNPASAKLSKIDLKWSDPDSLLKSLVLDRVNAHYGVLAFLGGGWHGSAVSIEKAELNVEMGKSNPKLSSKSERPVDFEFGLYQCLALDVDFGKGSLWDFKNGSVAYRVSDELDDQLSIDDGELTIPTFGEFSVKNGLVSFDSDSAQVFLTIESSEHAGIISVDGSVGYTEGSQIELKTQLQNYSLREWIDPRARRFFNGEITSGEGTLKMKLGDMDSFDITTEVSTKEVGISDFEFINTLAQLLVEDDYYANPKFTDQSKMAVSRKQSKIEFSGIDLIQNEHMRIKGDVAIDESNLISGSIRVGLPVVLVSSKRGEVLKSVFSDDDGEYIWAEVNLGGEASQPSDDLDEQFKAAAIKIGGQVPLFEQKFEEFSR